METKEGDDEEMREEEREHEKRGSQGKEEDSEALDREREEKREEAEKKNVANEEREQENENERKQEADEQGEVVSIDSLRTRLCEERERALLAELRASAVVGEKQSLERQLAEERQRAEKEEQALKEEIERREQEARRVEERAREAEEKRRQAESDVKKVKWALDATKHMEKIIADAAKVHRDTVDSVAKFTRKQMKEAEIAFRQTAENVSRWHASLLRRMRKNR